MSKLFLSSLSLFESASIGVKSNTISTLSMSSQSLLNFFTMPKLESYGPVWYYITLDIGKLVINICHSFRAFRTNQLIIMKLYNVLCTLGVRTRLIIHLFLSLSLFEVFQLVFNLIQSLLSLTFNVATICT